MLDLFDVWTAHQDIQVEFIIRKPLRKLAAELTQRGWKYYPLYFTHWAGRKLTKNPHDIVWNAKQNKRAINAIEKIIKVSQPDVVMTNTIVAPWAAIAAARLQVPHIWFVREYGETEHGFDFIIGRQPTFTAIGDLSQLVVTNSVTLAKYVSKFIEPAKVTTIYTPYDILALQQKAAERISSPFTQSDSLKLVLVGRIAPSKGQADAAVATGILNRQGIATELCIIGTPSDIGDDDSLKAAIDKYQIADKVHIVGNRRNPMAYIAKADIGIMAAGQEAFGRATFEYMALAKPVVGADSGATPELVTSGVNGYLYELGNPQSLAAALSHYATDKKLLLRHGQAARQKAQSMMSSKFNAEALYKKLTTLLATRLQTAPEYQIDWLNLPDPTITVLKDHGIKAVPKLLASKTRHLLKATYLRVK